MRKKSLLVIILGNVTVKTISVVEYMNGVQLLTVFMTTVLACAFLNVTIFAALRWSRTSGANDASGNETSVNRSRKELWLGIPLVFFGSVVALHAAIVEQSIPSTCSGVFCVILGSAVVMKFLRDGG